VQRGRERRRDPLSPLSAIRENQNRVAPSAIRENEAWRIADRGLSGSERIADGIADRGPKRIAFFSRLISPRVSWLGR
jgi:hypothetical protein